MKLTKRTLLVALLRMVLLMGLMLPAVMVLTSLLSNFLPMLAAQIISVVVSYFGADWLIHNYVEGNIFKRKTKKANDNEEPSKKGS